MREQFEKLVIELVENDIIEQQNAGEMLITLMEAVPTNLDIDTKVLIESLKKEFTVNAAILDSNNGINKDIVKTITEEKVKVEKEKVEKNKEQEAKREAQNSKSVEEALGLDENDKDKKEQEELTDEDEFNYEIPIEFKNKFDKFVEDSGFNIPVTQDSYQNAMYYVENGSTEEEAMELSKFKDLGEVLFNKMNEYVKKGMSTEAAKKLAYQECNVDFDNEEQVKYANNALASEIAANMFKAFSKRLREINKAGNKTIPIEKLSSDVFALEYLDRENCDDELRA